MLSHLFADDDAVDPHLQRIKNAADGEDSDEEDEDFVADKDDGGSSSDASEEEESDASESRGEKERPAKKEPKKEATGTKAPSSKKKSKGGDDEGSKKKRQKKKKDPNAPKRAMSGFMFFANAERENLKKSNPGMSFTDVGSALGEKWNKLTAEEKEPYDSMARADSKCYKEAMAGYRSRCSAMNIDSGGGSDSK